MLYANSAHLQFLFKKTLIVTAISATFAWKNETQIRLEFLNRFPHSEYTGASGKYSFEYGIIFRKEKGTLQKTKCLVKSMSSYSQVPTEYL